jgi:branched-chain amino acid aminotransferase
MNPGLPSNPLVYFQNAYVCLQEARVPLLTHALHYGTGVFEGIRGYWSREDDELYLFRVREHFERWRSNARILQMEIPPTSAELTEITLELVRRNQFKVDVYVRPLAYKSQQGIGVHCGGEMELAIVVVPFSAYVESAPGLRVMVSSWRRIDDNAIPARGKISGAYVNSFLAGNEARAAGYDEAIFLTAEGHVCEGSAANIFLVRQGRLVTPPVTEDILEGITRSTVMDLARDFWVETIERPVDRSELYMADEIFFAGTAFEVAPVIEVDNRVVGGGRIGPLTHKLQEMYQAVTRGTTTRRSHWRTPAYQRETVHLADVL